MIHKSLVGQSNCGRCGQPAAFAISSSEKRAGWRTWIRSTPRRRRPWSRRFSRPGGWVVGAIAV